MATHKSRTINKFQRDNYQSLNNLVTVRNYFKCVGSMDKANIKGIKSPAVERILSLWSNKGLLSISGDSKSVGHRTFSGIKELTGFYNNRSRGIDETFRKMTAHFNGAKSIQSKESSDECNRVVVNGIRHMMTREGEGFSAPFSHDFKFDETGKIASLQINIGKPTESRIAPSGSLNIQDMGKLAAVAWMVA